MALLHSLWFALLCFALLGRKLNVGLGWLFPCCVVVVVESSRVESSRAEEKGREESAFVAQQ